MKNIPITVNLRVEITDDVYEDIKKNPDQYHLSIPLDQIRLNKWNFGATAAEFKSFWSDFDSLLEPPPKLKMYKCTVHFTTLNYEKQFLNLAYDSQQFINDLRDKLIHSHNCTDFKFGPVEEA